MLVFLLIWGTEVDSPTTQAFKQFREIMQDKFGNLSPIKGFMLEDRPCLAESIGNIFSFFKDKLAEFDKNCGDLDRINREINEKQQECIQLKEKLKIEEENSSANVKQLDEKKVELQRLTEEKTRLSDDVQDLQGKAALLTEKEAKCARLEKDLIGQQAENALSAQQLTEKMEELQNLTAASADLSACVESLHRQIAELKTDNTSMQSEVTKMQEKYNAALLKAKSNAQVSRVLLIQFDTGGEKIIQTVKKATPTDEQLIRDVKAVVVDNLKKAGELAQQCEVDDDIRNARKAA